MEKTLHGRRSLPAIALLLGIPVTREEFFQRVTDSDWLAKYDSPKLGRAARKQHHEKKWEEEYAPGVADTLNELIHAAGSLAVTVRRNATLETLYEVTLANDVVVLLAHWKGAEISSQDISTPADKLSFVKRVEGNETPLARWLFSRLYDEGARALPRQHGVRKWLRFLSNGSSHRSRSVDRILNESLVVDLPDAVSGKDGIDAVIEHQATRAARRRDELDSLFSGILCPGNRLELFEGLHTRHEVEAAIAPGFGGVLDLAVCNAMVLGDYISARRRRNMRIVQLAPELDPAWAALSVKTAIELVFSEELDYLEARKIAARSLEIAVRETQQPKSILDGLRFWEK